MSTTTPVPAGRTAVPQRAGRVDRLLLAATMVVGPLVQVAFPLLQPRPADTSQRTAARCCPAARPDKE